MRRNRSRFSASTDPLSLVLLILISASGCTPSVRFDGDDSEQGGAGGSSGEVAQPASVRCEGFDGSLKLPDGFCAMVFADGVRGARHMFASASGDLYVAVKDGAQAAPPGGVVVYRDLEDDGRGDINEKFWSGGGNGITIAAGYLYFAEDDRVLRFRLPDGQLVPDAAPEVVVSGLPASGEHVTKSVAVHAGSLYVSIGSSTNSCQEQDGVAFSPGLSPCPELTTRAGIWRFAAGSAGQTMADGVRFATGIRDAVGIAIEPGSGRLFGVQIGRDRLHQDWPDRYTAEDDQRLPAEELLLIDEGDDFGWPYCYYDPALGRRVLAPEYGGDGDDSAGCARYQAPTSDFAAHSAPQGIHFYTGRQFPQRYAGGAFIAFHGPPSATTDAREPSAVSVGFLPAGHGAFGALEDFATSASGDRARLQRGPEHRTVGLAEGPDGSLYISDDRGGRIWRVYYEGP